MLFRSKRIGHALVGDHFVLRLPTPMVTLGGGRLLDHLPRFPRRRDFSELAYLNDRIPCTPDALVLTELRKLVMVRRDQMLREADISNADVARALDGLIEAGTVAESDTFVYLSSQLQELADKLKSGLLRYFGEHPHLKGVPIEPIGRMVKVPPAVWPPLLDLLAKRGLLVRSGDLIDLAGRGMSLKGVVLQAYDEIMAALRDAPYAPPPLTQLAARGKVHQQAIKYIIDSGEGYKCGSDFVFLTEVWTEIVNFIRGRLKSADRMAVAELRERFGFTRKFAIPILEECDRIGLTGREGDYRVKGNKFE